MDYRPRDNELHYEFKLKALIVVVSDILKLKPPPIIEIHIEKDIDKKWFELYGYKRDINAFYDRKTKIIYMPYNVKIETATHEIAHAVIDFNSPIASKKYHEKMARFAERMIVK
jgi:hypothetical protein